jgi:WD40 repeat protein
MTNAAHSGPVRSVAWSGGGRILLSSGEDRIIQVYAMDIDLLMSLTRSLVSRNLIERMQEVPSPRLHRVHPGTVKTDK